VIGHIAARSSEHKRIRGTGLLGTEIREYDRSMEFEQCVQDLLRDLAAVLGQGKETDCSGATHAMSTVVGIGRCSKTKIVANVSR
jgi:hypothetical protein